MFKIGDKVYIKQENQGADLCYIDYGDSWEIVPFGILQQ